jgi:hypothetical protein
VRAQTTTIWKIKSIHLSACGVMLWNIEGCEIMVVIFNFWAMSNMKTHFGENINDIFPNKSDRMQTTLLKVTVVVK